MESGESTRGRCWLNAVPTASISGWHRLTGNSVGETRVRVRGNFEGAGSRSVLTTGFAGSGRSSTLRLNRLATWSASDSAGTGVVAGITSSTENPTASPCCLSNGIPDISGFYTKSEWRDSARRSCRRKKNRGTVSARLIARRFYDISAYPPNRKLPIITVNALFNGLRSKPKSYATRLRCWFIDAAVTVDSAAAGAPATRGEASGESARRRVAGRLTGTHGSTQKPAMSLTSPIGRGSGGSSRYCTLIPSTRSMLRTSERSSGAAKVHEAPRAPARPVRPTR